MKTGLLFLSLLFLYSCQVNKKISVIFDTDANNEVDDQHALAYLLLNSNDFRLIGVTTNATRNGGDIEEHTKEAARIIRLCDSYGIIKLIPGANDEFNYIKENVKEEKFDGHEAVDFIIKNTAKRCNDKITILAVGKLTNVALALKKEPQIIPNIKIVWLGSNYPDKGEYNLRDDVPALKYILNTDVEFELVTVRYGKPSGTDAVRVTRADIRKKMPGMGPQIDTAVLGRNGNAHCNFGDYSVDLFENIEVKLPDSSRALYDMAAVAIIKNPQWADWRMIEGPVYSDEKGWIEQPGSKRKMKLWENFNKDAIIEDFFNSMENYVLPE